MGVISIVLRISREQLKVYNFSSYLTISLPLFFTNSYNEDVICIGSTAP